VVQGLDVVGEVGGLAGVDHSVDVVDCEVEVAILFEQVVDVLAGVAGSLGDGGVGAVEHLDDDFGVVVGEEAALDGELGA